MATINNLNGPIELHTINPNPDGCNSNSDSFTYWSSTSIVRSGGSYSFNAGGSWDSYCFGGVLNVGTWSASGPCSKVSGVQKVNPNGPAAGHANSFRFAISPNPLRSSSTISYELTRDSRLIVTVYNYMQQPLKVLVNENETAGKHSYTFDGKSSGGAALPNGVYRVVAVVDGKSYTSTLQIMR
jgi:flagellar hook capping protein FlgD